MRLLKGALFVGILAILVFGLPAVLASEEPTVAGESFSATAHSVGDNISGDSSATGTKTAADAEDPNSGERGTEPHTFLDWTATTFLNLLPKEYSLFPFVRSLLALPSRLPYELKLQPPFLFNRHSKYSPHLNEPFLPPPNASKGFVLVLEAKGGSDKMPAWHRHAGRRPDTVAIANALVRRGWTPVVWQYEDRTKDALEDLARTGNGLADLVANLSSREPGPPFDALVWRVNPQSHEPYTRSIVSIEELAVNLTPSAIPLLASHPKVMHTLGAKQGLYHLRSTGIGMSDTIRYTNAKELAEFAAVLAGSYNEGIAKMARARTELAKREVSESVRSPGFGGRVLKQNRGSQGEGVFVVRLAEPPHWAREGYPVWPAPDFEAMSLLSDKLPLDTMLSIQEASDNSIVNKTLGNFLTWMADLYLDPPGGSGSKEDRLIIDQRFLRRISEGEVRVVMGERWQSPFEVDKSDVLHHSS